jgi:hypothetical protein
VRTYYPDQRFVKLRIANPLHEPSNPSPDVLPVDARQFWDNMAAQSEHLYGEHAGPHEIPEKTAWRAVRMHWQKRGRQWVPRDQAVHELPFVLPSPEDVTWLGLLLEYYWITPQGELYKRSFEDDSNPNEYQDPPDLWWSPDYKTLFSFPLTETRGPCMPIEEDMSDQAEMFRRWAQRDAQCQLGFEVPLARMYWRGVGDSLSYRSDKWHDRNEERGLPGSREYIHLHSDGVNVYEDTPNLDETPHVVVIRGGKLDVEERGIVH